MASKVTFRKNSLCCVFQKTLNAIGNLEGGNPGTSRVSQRATTSGVDQLGGHPQTFRCWHSAGGYVVQLSARLMLPKETTPTDSPLRISKSDSSLFKCLYTIFLSVVHVPTTVTSDAEMSPRQGLEASAISAG